ncbi:MAG: hypothetical protein EP335_05515 [Alphaproteobacteria bacterium]|nr:MAG: hypothetical protein EP335_05515 [Alphaproteobacteria bacterium]
MADLEVELTRQSLPNILLVLLALLPTLLSSYVAIRTSRLEDNLKQWQDQSKLDLKIYDTVEQSLAGTPEQQKVALALVVSLASEPLKTRLLDVFRQSATTDPEVTALAHSAGLNGGTASADWHRWRYDLYYCTASPEGAQAGANAFRQALQAAGVSGPMQVRALTPAVNARQGFHIEGYVLHAPPGALDTAAAIGGLPEAPPFTVRPPLADTEHYMGLFFCPSAASR